tara:strand:+ start:1259 stop:2539 length:1281 start_codon:yes stop_codon:yes gene_type:complete
MKSTFINAIVALVAALGATSCGAQAAQGVEPEYTGGTAPYGNYGLWTIYQTSSEAFDGALSCAAVASLPGSYDAVRVERVADGYVFGVNGFDRESFGANGEYPLAYRFDGGSAASGEGMGRFVKDPAFPDDDWLSAFASEEDLNALGGFSDFFVADEIVFEIRNPGNRTGEDLVEMAFPIGTGEILLRSLDQCYEMAMRYARETEGPIPPCRNDGPRLPLSGLCTDAAYAYLNVVEGPEPELAADSCEWAINEAWMAGQMVLYRAAQCSGRTSRLIGGAGAHMANLDLIETAYHEDGSAFGKLDEEVRYADVIGRFKDTPAEDVEHAALYGRQREVPTSCKARKMDDVTDGYIVDVSKAERARQPQDEPPAHLCGSYGYGDDGDLWRVFQGYAVFLYLGQDAYQDIDYRSLTLLDPDGDGGWSLAE